MNNSIAVLIPAFNADETAAELLHRVRLAVGDGLLVVVDDGSMDRTSEIARDNGAVVLRHERNRGKGAALQTGFDFLKKRAGIEFVLTMDSDLQHLPEDIPKFLLVQSTTNADIVIGWRQRTGTRMPVHRRISNGMTSALVGLRTGRKIKDSQCGFRFFRRSVIERIRLESTGYEAETEFLLKAARLGLTIEFASVETVYGAEKSYMTHWATTVNFIKVLFRNYP
ncbi:MAG: glycosyltransferase family 2 protein [Ignavibacteriae bacterium]|nr:MAG: glycosyltransferase family 2 protein [Ignavibacteriota bacterium]